MCLGRLPRLQVQLTNLRQRQQRLSDGLGNGLLCFRSQVAYVQLHGHIPLVNGDLLHQSKGNEVATIARIGDFFERKPDLVFERYTSTQPNSN